MFFYDSNLCGPLRNVLATMSVLQWGILLASPLVVWAAGSWLSTALSLLVLCPVYFMGGVLYIYWRNDLAVGRYYEETGPAVTKNTTGAGLHQVVKLLKQEPPDYRLDRRLTGSHLIDESLQEILGYILRDQVAPWYNHLSGHPELPHQIRATAQMIIVNFATRVKEVDWVPYLTTRLVDDAASHLRLFRQARARTKPPDEPHLSHSRQASGSKLQIDNKVDTASLRSFGNKDVSPMHVPSAKHQSPSGASAGSSSSGSSCPQDLEAFFFDLEVTMENQLLCRDLVCTQSEQEKQYLQDVAEILLFLLLPEADFHCQPLKVLLRELLVNAIVLPVFAQLSDPDYINQTIIWLCRDVPMTSEAFLTILRSTDNLDELIATKDIVERETAQLRSRDSGGEDDTWVKQQLSSLVYVGKVIDGRISRLKEGADSDSAGLPAHADWSRYVSSGPLFMLPMNVILKNNIALSYFIEYMSSIGAQAYLFFYLNVEGWRVSAEQQLSDLELQRVKDGAATAPATLENMKDAAYSILEQYLSEKASPRLKLDESVVKRLVFRIRSEQPNETWFDEIQGCVFEKLQNEDRFLPTFRRSGGYVKLLAELDLLKDNWSRSDEDEADFAISADEISLSDSASLGSLDAVDGVTDGSNATLTVPTLPQPATPVSPSEKPDRKLAQGPFTLSAEIVKTGVAHEKNRAYGIYAVAVYRRYETGYEERWHVFRRYSDFYDLHQKIKERYSEHVSTGLRKGCSPVALTLLDVDVGWTHALLLGLPDGLAAQVTILKQASPTQVLSQHRRALTMAPALGGQREEKSLLTTFLDGVIAPLNQFLNVQKTTFERIQGGPHRVVLQTTHGGSTILPRKWYVDLGRLTFPGKKTFNNMDRSVLEKRMKMLNDYLQILMGGGVVQSHPGLEQMLLTFLEQGEYDRGGNIARSFGNLVAPLKSSARTVGQAVRAVPDSLLSTVDSVVDGLSRVFQARTAEREDESVKVGAVLDAETDDNIPLRIILLLLDEVFDLKSRNQWLRRRIVTLLRQIIRTMFGDIVNRRILDYVSVMTSPEQVADYLRNFKHSVWPSGCRAEPFQPRDEATRLRTRVAAKVALLSSLSDELKHIIGSETMRRGLLRVFELFQRPVLNRRLLYVFLEGFLCTLFPQHTLAATFRRLHSRSSRVQDNFKTSQRLRKDLMPR